MSLLRCSKCQGRIEFLSEDKAKCTVHGGEFQVLFAHEMPELSAASAQMESLPGKCARHPEIDQSTSCGFCSTALCQTCEMPMSSGKIACPDCAEKQARFGTSRSMVGVKCASHPEVQAVNTCHSCHVGVCSTCDFKVTGDLHLCPTCATKPPDTKLSSAQKKQLVGSSVLAVFSMVGFVFGLIVAGGSEGQEGEAIAGIVLSLFCLMPAIGGSVLASLAFQRNKPNTAWHWIALVINVLVVLSFLLLSIVGTFMG